MGLRDKLRGVVQKALTGGGGPSSPKPPASTPAEPAKGATPAPVAAAEAADKPWYLEGTDSEGVEGWDQTNPGGEPGKTNLRD